MYCAIRWNLGHFGITLMKNKTLNAVVDVKQAFARDKEIDALKRRLQLRLFLLSLKEVRLSLRLLATRLGKAVLEGIRYILQFVTHTDPKVIQTRAK